MRNFGPACVVLRSSVDSEKKEAFYKQRLAVQVAHPKPDIIDDVNVQDAFDIVSWRFRDFRNFDRFIIGGTIFENWACYQDRWFSTDW